MAIVTAEKGFRTAAVAALDSDAPPVVPVILDDPCAEKTMTRAAFNALDHDAQAKAAKDGIKIVD